MSTTIYPTVTPYLTVNGAEKAIAFYQKAFGAKELFRLTVPTDGKIGHAELELRGGGLIMLSDENAFWNKSPETLKGTAVKLSIMVEDVDAVIKAAEAAGATVTMPAADQFYGHRSGGVRDPFGHEWMIQKEIEKVEPAEMQRRFNEMCCAKKEK